ncbi:pleckstrin homology domain-containing family M member 2-like isoform X2 [Stegodyphus dumicola]|uniref:pleckstrin homology domain-containing family M member 2-like isoform X2 n=1 Tax=Stegodyphus dumicola TaxID=202533 RepID=UPI0015AA8FF5|nr:pleckstrin homology domain-containing family M member 2-like isoform X2 [Stegodyphus dumicola]
MTMVSTIPVAGTVSIFNTHEDSKDQILFTLQIAVKQIQHYSCLQNQDDGLSADVKEVKQLCESLDKALLHGLKYFDKGYWAFVKEFTHSNNVKFLEKLENVDTDVQCGRAWLSLALNEASLESYFRSFTQNLRVVKKHYESLALLCDEQRMQLVLMLMAGLEYVPININVGKISYGTGVSFFENQPNFQNSDIYGYYKNSPNKVPKNSFPSDDTELAAYDSAVEVTTDFVASGDASPENQKSTFDIENSLHKQNSGFVESIACQNLPQQDLERISHYINIDTKNETKVTEDLEVIRTKVVRRAKRSCQKSFSDNDKSENSLTNPTGNEKKSHSLQEYDNSLDHRLSKATNDSGLCLETPCTSDSESNDFADEAGTSDVCHSTSFNVGEFHPDLNVTFSIPLRNEIELHEISTQMAENSKPSLEERGIPEGQEDPIKNTCKIQNVSNRLPLQVGDDGAEDNAEEEEEEEISIYDMSKISYFTPTPSSPKIIDISNDAEEKPCPGTCKGNSETKDIVLDEIEKLAKEKPEDLDIKVANNIILYFVVEVFEHEEESFYKLYCGYSNFPEGSSQRIYFLLTNKGVYFLKSGNKQQKFFKSHSLRYSSIDYIVVDLNYQGFKVVSRNKESFPLYTADEELTREILSNFELGIRRFIPKLPLPSVYTDACIQKIILSKFVASQLNLEKSDVNLCHYVLARWEDYTSSSITPTGPIYYDYLMYRHKFAKDNTATSWTPGYFLLKAGVLYCMDDEKSKPNFDIPMCTPHCQGCRRIHLLDRPYAFEIIRSNSASLQLAAADTVEASKWLQCFLETVSLAGHYIDSEKNVQKPCYVLLSNDSIIVAMDEPRKSSLKPFGKAKLCDLVTVFIDPLASTFIMLEFEIAEASKSSGEWIIYFETIAEKEKFLDIINQKWSEMFQAKESSSKPPTVSSKQLHP